MTNLKMKNYNTKYIFITSESKYPVGKGVLAAATGLILSNRGYTCTYIKFSSQIELDDSNFTPNKSGGCFILERGDIVAVDLGLFETFTGIKMSSNNYLTKGKIIEKGINTERFCLTFIDNNLNNECDFCIIEIGSVKKTDDESLFINTVLKLKEIVGEERVVVVKVENEFNKSSIISKTVLYNNEIQPNNINEKEGEIDLEENDAEKSITFCGLKVKHCVDLNELKNIGENDKYCGYNVENLVISNQNILDLKIKTENPKKVASVGFETSEKNENKIGNFNNDALKSKYFCNADEFNNENSYGSERKIEINNEQLFIDRDEHSDILTYTTDGFYNNIRHNELILNSSDGKHNIGENKDVNFKNLAEKNNAYYLTSLNNIIKISRKKYENSDLILRYKKNPHDYISMLEQSNYLKLMFNMFKMAIDEQAFNPQFKTYYENRVNVSIVGKYTEYCEPYTLIKNALYFSAKKIGVTIEIFILDARLVCNEFDRILALSDAIVISGGNGKEHNKGMLYAIKYAMDNDVPILCICLGFQLALIEIFSRKLGMLAVDSEEFDKSCENKLFVSISDINNDPKFMKVRTGENKIMINEKSRAFNIYNYNETTEFHRHGYVFNMKYFDEIDQTNIIVSGFSENQKILEMFESKEHTFLVGVQFHPEMKAKIYNPHPLFDSLLLYSMKKYKNNCGNK